MDEGSDKVWLLAVVALVLCVKNEALCASKNCKELTLCHSPWRTHGLRRSWPRCSRKSQCVRAVSKSVACPLKVLDSMTVSRWLFLTPMVFASSIFCPFSVWCQSFDTSFLHIQASRRNSFVTCSTLTDSLVAVRTFHMGGSWSTPSRIPLEKRGELSWKLWIKSCILAHRALENQQRLVHYVWFVDNTRPYLYRLMLCSTLR